MGIRAKGARIASLREKKEWKQDVLARQAVCSTRTIQTAEADGIVSENSLLSIAKALEVSAESIGEWPPNQAEVGKLFNVPQLPARLFDRSGETNRLKARLIDPSRENGRLQPVRMGIQGMSGVGKSVLAALVANDPDVRENFPDGIVWLSLGQQPPLETRQLQAAQCLAPRQAHEIKDVQHGKTVLQRLLEKKRCLIVLDDVWDSRHAGAFDHLSAGGALLITTQDRALLNVLQLGEYKLNSLANDAALQMLAVASGKSADLLPPEAAEVVKRCGGVAVALAVCGAMVRDGYALWVNLVHALAEADLAFLNHPDGNVLACIDASVMALPKADRDRYLELAVFCHGSSVPEAAIATLWASTGDLQSRHSTNLIGKLARRELIQTLETPPNRTIQLHDLHQAYLRLKADGPAPHRQLVHAYSKAFPGGWHAVSPDDYFHRNIIRHFLAAGLPGEARKLLFNVEWIRVKLNATDRFSFLSDFELIQDDVSIHRLRDALAAAATLHDRQLVSQLGAQLSGIDDPVLADMLRQARATLTFPIFECLTPYFSRLKHHALRSYKAHRKAVEDVIAFPRSKLAASTANDRTVRVWDTESGETICTIETGCDFGRAIAVTPDGRLLFYEASDGIIGVWNLQANKLERTLTGHKGVITALAVNHDGSTLYSGSSDGPTIEWDLRAWRQVRTVGGSGGVSGLVLSPDGDLLFRVATEVSDVYVSSLSGTPPPEEGAHHIRYLAIGDDEDFIRDLAVSADGRYVYACLWHAQCVAVMDWQRCYRIGSLTGHANAVVSVAVTADGRYAISGSWDQQIHLWDLKIGNHLDTIGCHGGTVNALALSSDESRLLSASDDHTIKVWDFQRALRALETPRHHGDICTLVASPDGTQLFSGSADTTIKVWDAETLRLIRTLEGHTNFVRALAISHDGRHLISGGADRRIIFWDAASGKPTRIIEDAGGDITALTLAPDGKSAVSGSREAQIKLWSIENERDDHAFAALDSILAIIDLVISPDGRYLFAGTTNPFFGGWMGDCEALEFPTGKLLAEFPRSKYAVGAIAFSPDRRRIILGSHEFIKVLELESWRETYCSAGKDAAVSALAMGSTGYLFTLSHRRNLTAWQFDSMSEVATFTANIDLSQCVALNDGCTVIVGDSAGYLHRLRLVLPTAHNSFLTTASR